MDELTQLIQQERIKVAREKIAEYFKDVVHPYFPNCKLRSASPEFIEGIHIFHGTILNFEPTNSHLYNSEYSYQKELQFVHYTSANNCLNIIREESLRMYNLNSMDDSFELKYATEGSAFNGLSEKQIRNWKENIYSLSMCEIDVEKEGKSFDNWRRYGDDGNGVGVVLSFDNNNQETWLHRYLSKIHYTPALIEKIIKAHVKFHRKNKDYHVLGSYQELLVNLCCFHKPPIYSSENEIRFLEFDNPFPHDKDYLMLYKTLTGVESNFIIFRKEIDSWEKFENSKGTSKNKIDSEIDISKKFEPIRFKRLPISDKMNEKQLEKITCPFILNNKEHFFPKVKIEKIIFGYRYDDERANKLKSVIEELALTYLGYKIDFETTKLKRYF